MKRKLLCGKERGEKRRIRPRISAFLLLCLVWTALPAALSGQTPQRITLRMENATVAQVVDRLMQTTGYEFFFRSGDMPATPVRNYAFANATIETVMDKLLEGTDLEWAFRNGAVAITLKQGRTTTQPAAENITIEGYVHEKGESGRGAPLPFATIAIPELGTGTTADAEGHFVLRNVPPRKVMLQVKYLGFEEQNREVDAARPVAMLYFEMPRSDFRLENVTVTAEESRGGAATSSTVSRTAMDHMQTGSLKDVMALVPGGVIENQSLGSPNLLNIRMTQRSTVNNASGVVSNLMNSFGTAVVVDGAPVSNDANLQVMAAGQNSVEGIASGNSPLAGADVRSISTDNISSVEIIRGVPSVEYGNLTSGAVIVNSKAGAEPLSVRFKTNPMIYQASANKGFLLGGRAGTLNAGVDYARDVKDQRTSYISYTRLTGKLLYSNTFFDNRLSSNTSLDIIYGKNNAKQNPDDLLSQHSSYARETGLRFNTNGVFNFGSGWLRNIRYTASVSYTDKNTFEASLASGRNTYSNSLIDGSVVTNRPGDELTDTDGNMITIFPDGAGSAYAYTTDVSHLQHRRIQGKELNVFAKVNANFINDLGSAGINRLLVGADFKTDGNRGRGLSFDTNNPPSVSTGALYASLRPVSYKDIPFIHQVGIYAEDNLILTLGKHTITLQAGLRYDCLPGAPMENNQLLSPRGNLIIDLIPGKLSLRGGYGVTAKSPSVLFLYPDLAYYDIPYFSNAGTANLPSENRLDIVGTRVVETGNEKLKMAVNTKSEVGFDLTLPSFSLNVTGYYERLKNGYALKQTPASTLRLEKPYYSNTVSADKFPEIAYDPSRNQTVFSYYNEPTNLGNIINSGVEFTLSTKRFDPIRTQFVLSGAWLRSDIFDDGYELYSASYESQMKGLYDNKAANRTVYDRFTTTLRATHNIPRLGFVVTLAAQVTWLNDIKGRFGDDATPLGYITTADNQIHFFSDSDPYTDDKYKGIRKADNSAVKSETYIDDLIRKPVLLMNLNLTKEIKDYLRVSFFVNNMFSSHPLIERTKRPGEYYRMNQDIFFGLELSFTLK